MVRSVQHYSMCILFVGLYGNAPKPPCVLGYEASGVISQLGEGVDDFKVNLISKFLQSTTGKMFAVYYFENRLQHLFC